MTGGMQLGRWDDDESEPDPTVRAAVTDAVRSAGWSGSIRFEIGSRVRGARLDTVAGGESVIDQPAAGEVVWCDDAGVTCRRRNWRQAQPTQLADGTSAAVAGNLRERGNGLDNAAAAQQTRRLAADAEWRRRTT